MPRRDLAVAVDSDDEHCPAETERWARANFVILIREFPNTGRVTYKQNEARRTTAVMVPITQGMLIGFSGAALYFVVDRYEPDEGMAAVLKFLVVLLGAAAVLRCTGLFGGGFF